MSELSEKVINGLIERNANLEFELEKKQQIIDKAIEYIEKDTRWFDSEYAKTYGELCTCAGANDTRLEVLVNPSNLLEILQEKEVKKSKEK